MKNFIKWAAVGLGAFLALPSFAQVTPTRFISAGLPTTFAAAATSNMSVTPFMLQQGKGVSFVPEFTMSAASVSNTVFTFQLSYDGGTSYTTVLPTPLTLTVVQNGTNLVRSRGIFTADSVNHATHIKVATIQNTHGSATLANFAGYWASSN
jgi:hypothetical protein